MAATPNFDLMLTVLLAVMLAVSIFSRKVKLPYTLALVMLGIIIAIPSISSQAGISTFYISISTFYNNYLGTLFVGLVLPPLLFESMMNIRSSELKAVIRPALGLATVGVLLATVVGGLLLWKIAGLPIYESFLFSSLISPTDTASVLEIFKRMRVPRKLSALMDSEAAFNDATGVIIFSLIFTSGRVIGLPFGHALLNFSIVLGGGVLIGLAIGFASELISSLVADPLTETALSISMVYGSYYLSTTLGFSGLVSVAVTGLYYGNLTLRTAVRPLSREHVKIFWGVIAFIANSVAFLFIGFNVKLEIFASSLLLIVAAFLVVFAARFTSVYSVLSIFGRGSEKSRRWKNVAVLGGMRGALSVALVLAITQTASLSLDAVTTLRTLTLGVVFLSLVIQSPTLAGYIRRHFKEEQQGEFVEPNIRLYEILRAIEELHKLRQDGKMSEVEFVERLQDERDRLAHLLSEINISLKTGDIVRSRAKDLYSSIASISRSRAMEILRRQKEEEPISTILQNSSMENEK